jgi:hypothetical protein
MFLFILLFSLNANAFDMEEVYSVVPEGNLRFVMKECGFNHANKALFLKNLTQEQFDCLKLKAPDAKAIIDSSESRRNKVNQARLYFKNLNCKTIVNEFNKNACLIFKRGL